MNSLENNTKDLLKSQMDSPEQLLSEVIVLYNSLQQKFPLDPQAKKMVSRLEPIYQAASRLEVDKTQALVRGFLSEKP
jgi:hypothetical protein